MAIGPRIGLSEAEKDALLVQQGEMIERLVARISELEALVGKKRQKAAGGKRPPREGKARPLAEAPDKSERVVANACGHCGTDVSNQTQHCRHRYDHIDLPPSGRS